MRSNGGTRPARYVVAGYSAAMIDELDLRLPADSVVLVEEPHVLTARGALDLASRSACVAEVVPAPTQSLQRDELRIIRRPADVVAVLPAVEYSVVAAAVLAHEWGLPGAGIDAACTLRDKTVLRRRAAVGGLAQPRWVETRDADDVDRFLSSVGAPVVLKPANRQASLGVQVIAPGDDVAAAWRHTTTADEPRLHAPGALPAKFMAEVWMSGPELSVEMLRSDGVTLFANVTAKRVQGGRFPVEAGHVVPAGVPDTLRAALVEATEALAGAIEFGTGVLHAEWIVIDGLPHLVECAGRLPGDHIDTLISLTWGFDLLSAFVDTLTGRPGNYPTAARSAAALTFFDCVQGVVTEVTGTAEASAVEGVHEIEVSVAPGDERVEARSSWERCGHALAVGGSPGEAQERADRAASLVTIRTSG